MPAIYLPTHGKIDQSVHRQLMFDASQGRGFRPDFMERTMVQFNQAPVSFFKAEQSERQKRKAKTRELYLTRCEANACEAATGREATKLAHDHVVRGVA